MRKSQPILTPETDAKEARYLQGDRAQVVLDIERARKARERPLLTAENATEYMRAVRGLGYADICERCRGWGVYLYATTSTWHGGIGGAAMTQGVCDRCWGSGDANRPWPSHREFYEQRKQAEKFQMLIDGLELKRTDRVPPDGWVSDLRKALDLSDDVVWQDITDEVKRLVRVAPDR